MPIQVAGSHVYHEAVRKNAPFGIVKITMVGETTIDETVVGKNMVNSITTVLPTVNTPPENFRYWSKWLFVFVAAWAGVVSFGFDQPTEVFHENWPFFFVGLLGATIGNITAIGGGLVFVPFTMLIYGMDAVSSLKLAIASQAFGMTSGAIAWWSRDRVPKKVFFSILPAILIGCLIGGLAFRVDGALVKGLFGPVSCAIGILTLILLYYPVKTTSVRNTLGLHIITAAGSVLTAWVAIGVGEAIAAFLMLRHRVCAERSVALGVAALSASSILLFIIFSFIGPMPWEQIAFMGLGCVFGGRLAPLLSRRVPQHTIKIIFAIVALADGALFIYNYYF